MVIQHNMAAANANRMLGQVVTNQSKSTEKLSSGFRINRAADDAAGLSISEKMRGQIRGLDQASTNAQDGISMIQTAEGALNESHSILQRMRELSVQASTGTETDDDREAIQDEVTQLQEELDRIAETTEFNTMKLLDGSLGGNSTTKGVNVNFEYSNIIAGSGAITTTSAEKGIYTSAEVIGADSGMQQGDVTSLTIDYLDEKGNAQTVTIDLKYKDLTTLESSTNQTTTVTSGAADETEKGGAFLSELKKSVLAESFDIEYDTTNKKFTFTAKKAGTNTPTIVSQRESNTKTGVTTQTAVTGMDVTPSADSFQSLDAATLTPYDGAATSDIEDAIFEVNGKKFAFVTAAGETALKNKTEYSDVNYIVASATPVAADATKMKDLINAKTGINAEIDATTDTQINLKAGAGSSIAGNGAVSLQIGANEGQTIEFSINDMSSTALGVKSVNVSDQDSAKRATTTIDDAIKLVSKQRSALGAVQNRLEHTIANLDTSSENLQTAESRIRDVDMASEMVNFTKNNILQQAAQSMLAQANQSNQGVLSLLQ